MEENSLEALKYPIGKFQWPNEPSMEDITGWIHEIEQFPEQLGQVVAQVSPELLQTPYRPDGWTVQQLVHHIADSHLNSYIRFKWALTEDAPTIKAYNEKTWAKTPEIEEAPIQVSVDLLKALHRRWVYILRQMQPSDWEKTFIHPESGKVYGLGATAALYAWHGKHHLAHITGLMQRQNG